MTVIVQKNDRKVVIDKKESQVTINKNTLGSNFTNFTAAADSGNSQITEGETLTLTGGTGITTAVSGDTVTFSVTDAEVLLQNEDINGGQF
tara:strand:+ start:234 stop:506 length:273 start_codon:yes stop_codon:yes gene_type:complete